MNLHDLIHIIIIIILCVWSADASVMVIFRAGVSDGPFNFFPRKFMF